jgi:hypothetical protein
MTIEQQKIIDDFVSHHGMLVQEFKNKPGEIKVVEPYEGMVQILIGNKVSEDIGISLHWLESLRGGFGNISIGTTVKNKEIGYSLYISLFRKNSED